MRPLLHSPAEGHCFASTFGRCDRAGHRAPMCKHPCSSPRHGWVCRQLSLLSFQGAPPPALGRFPPFMCQSAPGAPLLACRAVGACGSLLSGTLPTDSSYVPPGQGELRLGTASLCWAGHLFPGSRLGNGRARWIPSVCELLFHVFCPCLSYVWWECESGPCQSILAQNDSLSLSC